MTSLTRELVFLILQFLDEEKFKETVHKLEQESGFFFNMKYFEDEVQNGNWDDVEKYLSGFTKVEDNRYSMKIIFEIRKQKYLEALDKHDRAKAVEILVKDLKVFASFNVDLFKEITQLLTLDNFRENEQLSNYGDIKSARTILLVELKKLIESNPVFCDKLQFPNLENSRLRAVINQSLNWQHQLCKCPRPNPDIKTLFVDHSCEQANGALALSIADIQLISSMPEAGALPPLGPNGRFRSASAPVPSTLAGWMSDPPPVSVAMLQHPRTPPIADPAIEYLPADSDHISKRTRPIVISDEVSLPVNMLPVTFPQNHNQAPIKNTAEDIPKTVARTFSLGSNIMSMDFHPVQQIILLVGTNIGDIALWNVGTGERLVLKTFKVWELTACSRSFQASLRKDPAISVNRIVWSPDGSLFGVAYSRHIVQLYSYHSGVDIRQQIEIDAHAGAVNDIAFAHLPDEHLSIITCGDDKIIKVWDATSGTKQYTFEGHEAPVYCVCPHQKDRIPFIFSTALNGIIKAWLYDNCGSRVHYNAPGGWCTTMAYSACGSRLFSCGTSKEGETYLIEWDEADGTVKRTYQGLRKRSLGVVQFDTSPSGFLVAGDNFLIKFWDMDNTNLLTIVDAEGGLQACPRIRFNKKGTLLAVSTQNNGFKVLANTDGLLLLRALENLLADASSIASEMDVDSRNYAKPMIVDESVENSKIWKLTEVSEPTQCRSLRIMDNSRASKIVRLIYTNSGVAILALASNAIHQLWKWPCNDRNPSGKANANIAPLLWQPPRGILMTNELTGTNPAEAAPCFALSKNDSYVMSTSGGKVSLFNMMTFKTLTTFMAPPPAATFLAFHPQDNNIIAIGMDDSTILIYNVRFDEVKNKLRGHTKRITGLAFSTVLNVLVSSGSDAQVFVWKIEGWEKQRSGNLQVPSGHNPSDTCVIFHQDQIHFLAVHETQIAIYEPTKLECIRKWAPHEGSAPISHATFSCDSQLIYASFLDATVCIFSAANLSLRCRILPTAYLPANISTTAQPLVVAAHPSEPNQFALGLTDGSIHVLEPLGSEGEWGVNPPDENGTTPSTGTSTSDQQ